MGDVVISSWCNDDDHGNCANRTYDECHCQCECHGPTSVVSKYLSFEDNLLLGKGKKTKVILVISKRSDHVLGEIRWYGSWRQYVFFPAPQTIWNPECLRDVNECIARLMAERRWS